MDSFDPESGQVYREVIVDPGQRIRVRWEHRCFGSKPRNVLSQGGADSLTAMTLRKLVCHADQLSADTLAALPTYTVHHIRKAIRREGCETFNTWKAFAESGHEDKTFKFAANLHSLYQPLVNFFLDLVSPSFSWMVDLDLTNVYCSPIDLRQLSSCSNLFSLRIRYTERSGKEPFDDEVVQNMAHRAISDSSFNRLRMIFVTNAPGITAGSFNHIGQLPALDTFCVTGTSIRSRDVARGEQNGWHISQDSEFSSYVNAQDLRVRYQNTASHHRVADLVEGYIQQRRSSSIASDWNLPSVDVSLGSRNYRAVVSCVGSSDSKCFERKLELNSNKHKLILDPSPIHPEGLQKTKEPPTKKRKLKHSRTLGLNEMLDGL